jgi:hypothetical protein
MALDLSALEAEITRDEEVNSSAATLISSLASEIERLKNDPAALQALVNRLRTNSDALSAAVAANTPGEPEPPPEG